MQNDIHNNDMPYVTIAEACHQMYEEAVRRNEEAPNKADIEASWGGESGSTSQFDGSAQLSLPNGNLAPAPAPGTSDNVKPSTPDNGTPSTDSHVSPEDMALCKQIWGWVSVSAENKSPFSLKEWFKH